MDDLFKGRSSDALRTVVAEVAGVARIHLQHARKLAGRNPKACTADVYARSGIVDVSSGIGKAKF